MDHAAATPSRKEVVRSMRRFWSIDFGNAGAIHKEGLIAKEALEKSRQTIAEIIKARPDEIIFNSGGAEANNSAIFGFLDKLNENGIPFNEMRIMTTVIEHPSVLERVKYFEKKGVKIDYLNIGQNGIIDLKQFKKILKPDGYAVVEVANLQGPIVTPLAWDVAREISKVLHFEGEIIVCWEGGDKEGGHSYGYGYDHSYCLIFRKK